VQIPGKRATLYAAIFIVLLLAFAFLLLNYTRRVDGVSMLPTLEEGDLVVIQPVQMSSVHLGDIIVYGPPCSTDGDSIIHRVVGTAPRGGFYTQGDDRVTNRNTDQQLGIASGPITQACLVGKVVFIIPYIERLASLPYGLNYVLAVLVFTFIVISELIMKRPSRDQEPQASEQDVGVTVSR